jgi:hypothetical protein
MISLLRYNPIKNEWRSLDTNIRNEKGDTAMGTQTMKV